MSELPESFQEPFEQRWEEQEQTLYEEYGEENIRMLINKHQELLKQEKQAKAEDR